MRKTVIVLPRQAQDKRKESMDGGSNYPSAKSNAGCRRRAVQFVACLTGWRAACARCGRHTRSQCRAGPRAAPRACPCPAPPPLPPLRPRHLPLLHPREQGAHLRQRRGGAAPRGLRAPRQRSRGQTCKKTHHLFLSAFPIYVCPEPVLAK